MDFNFVYDSEERKYGVYIVVVMIFTVFVALLSMILKGTIKRTNYLNFDSDSEEKKRSDECGEIIMSTCGKHEHEHCCLKYRKSRCRFGI